MSAVKKSEPYRKRTPRRRGGRRSGAVVAWSAAFLFMAAMAWAARGGYLPGWVPCVYAGMSVVTYLVYRSDKARAGTVMWRTPESTLHWLEMLGGWPGALAAQWHIGHKNRKSSYQVVFWMIVITHVVALGFLLRQGIEAAGNSGAAGNGSIVVEML